MFPLFVIQNIETDSLQPVCSLSATGTNTWMYYSSIRQITTFLTLIKKFFHFLNLRVKDRQDHLIPTRTNIKFRHIRRQLMKNLTKSEHQEHGTHYLIILHPKT